MPKTDYVLILGVPTVAILALTGSLLALQSCKICHRFYTITGLSSQQRLTLVDTARLKRPLLIKVGI
jgi:recombinational DNA repair protein (RecF pathway)